MSLELMNVDRKRDESGEILPVADENNNCIVTKVTAYGRTALLTSDLDPTEGDTIKVAEQLIEQLGDEEEYQPKSNSISLVKLEGNYPK